jgi:hypothetical protein
MSLFGRDTKESGIKVLQVVDEVAFVTCLLEDFGIPGIASKPWFPPLLGYFTRAMLLVQKELPELFGSIVSTGRAARHADDGYIMGGWLDKCQ